MFNVGDTLLKLATESGFAGFFANGGWQNLVMIVIACVLLYLGIVKGFEPLLLVGIAFGCLLANVSYFPGLDAVNPELNATNAMYHPELWSAFLDSTSPYYHSYGHILSNAGLLDIFYIGVKAGLYPSLIFMGVGAMTDFGPLIADPKSLLLGAAALMPFALNDLKKRDIQLTKADWGYFTLLGFLTVTLHMSLLQMAVLHMDASATSIIYSGNPVFAVALAHFILHEPLKKNHLLAIGVELVGILFILNPAHLEISLRGFLEIITATLLFATYGTLCKLRLPRLGALVITTFNMLIGGLELLFLLMLGEIPAVGALYSGLGLEIFAGIPFFTGFTLKTTLLLCHVGIGCAAIGFLLTAKITEYTSATEASFVYLVKPILATALAVVVYHEHISVNRMVGIAFFAAASLCVSVPVLREMRRERAVKT